jgi:alpha-N-acetylglucosaminidase
MKTFKYIFAVILLTQIFSCTHRSGVPKTEFSQQEQKKAATDLIKRVVPDYADSFVVEFIEKDADGKDLFEVESQQGKIILRGNDGVSIASALNYYLKHFCHCQISWNGINLDIPNPMPTVPAKVVKKSPYKYRYYLNYCTFNYTASWWQWDRWQWEIDFMALNGVNMPLAVTGQNSVWKRVYQKLGFTDSQLEGFFSGPAYFNWFWMGNLDGWGGPLPSSFMEKHEELQKQILTAERSLGMTPILPAFTGHVPPDFATKFPDVRLRQTSWVNFPEVNILDPSEEMFTEIGRMFIEEQAATYGTNHFYTADTFNENEPPTNDPSYLADISRKVYQSMAVADPEAVWVMQGWLFYHDRSFWGNNEIEALLGAVPNDRMLILDLWSERFPIWNRTNAYDGKPWIWCMLQNFGQNITLSGRMNSVAHDPALALANPMSGNMAGIGVTAEGIEQNPVMFELMWENAWRDTPIELDEWLRDYTLRRYGKEDRRAEQAWKILSSNVYEDSLTNGGPESIITGRPTFAKNPGGTTNTRLPYDNRELVRAWELLIEASYNLSNSDGFRYDLVDVTRQVLANYASVVQQNCAESYRSGDIEAFRKDSHRFLELISDLDALLATRREFLLGRWLEAAKAMGDTATEKFLYEHNARNLITTWGNRDCRIRDYACRQWSGMMSGFYRPRWERFFGEVEKAMIEGREFDQKAFDTLSKNWEWNWTFGTETYPTLPYGNAVITAQRLHAKYRNTAGRQHIDFIETYRHKRDYDE